MTGAEARAAVLGFLQRNPRLFAALEDDDARGAELFEAMTGKVLRLRWDEISEAKERTTPLRPAPYLVVVLQDGRQVALADVGFAFAPSIASTGPLPELPETFCFRDFRHLTHGVAALLAEDGREKEALAGVMLAIALLDGARVLGFEVDREERALESLLKQLEEHGVKT